jgi:hypothetical protein
MLLVVVVNIIWSKYSRSTVDVITGSYSCAIFDRSLRAELVFMKYKYYTASCLCICTYIYAYTGHAYGILANILAYPRNTIKLAHEGSDVL